MSPRDGVKKWAAEGIATNPLSRQSQSGHPLHLATLDYNMADKLPRRALYPSCQLRKARRRRQSRSNFPKPQGYFEEKIKARVRHDLKDVRGKAKSQGHEEGDGVTDTEPSSRKAHEAGAIIGKYACENRRYPRKSLRAGRGKLSQNICETPEGSNKETFDSGSKTANLGKRKSQDIQKRYETPIFRTQKKLGRKVC